MLNYLWGGMIVIGVIYAACNGTIPAIADAALDSAKEAVTLCVTMLGVLSLWTGLMEIAQCTGMIRGFTAKIKPLIRFLFPNIPAEHPALVHIATNFVANFLGLGWAATPAGLKTMESLRDLESERQQGVKSSAIEKTNLAKRASDEMCTFLVLNISSLQLIPVSIIAYRSQYGSVSPAAVVGPGIVATLVSTLTAVLFCRIMCRRSKRRRQQSRH